MTSIQHLEILHNEIHAEHLLISNRMSWYLASQAFLMTAFAIAGNDQHHYPWLAHWLLPALGVSLSTLTWIGIVAAVEAMRRLRIEEFLLLEKHAELKILPFKRMPQALHLAGMAPPTIIPLIFIAAWILCAVNV